MVDAAEPPTVEQAGDDEGRGGPLPGLRLRPMVHVQNMGASVAFYESLGAHIVNGSRDGDWVLMGLSGSQWGLLAHPPNPEQDEGQVELNFQTEQSLDAIAHHLRSRGVHPVHPVAETGFGRQLQVRTPDGLLVKIDQLDPDIFR